VWGAHAFSDFFFSVRDPVEEEHVSRLDEEEEEEEEEHMSRLES
jgi:hypothetical protein